MIILYLIPYSPRNRIVTKYIAAHIFGLQSEIVNFLVSPYLVLYSARSGNVTNIVHFSGFKSESSVIILYLKLYSAPDKNVTYIVDFLSLQSEKRQL